MKANSPENLPIRFVATSSDRRVPRMAGLACFAVLGFFAAMSSGSAQTCELVKDINQAPEPTFRYLRANPPLQTGRQRNDGMTTLDGYVYFHGQGRLSPGTLWRSNGQVCEEACIVNPNRNAFPSEAIACGGRIFFSAFGPGVGVELHVYDPSTESCRLVKDINPGEDHGQTSFLAKCRDKIFFRAFEPRRRHQLYVTDGTEAGTVRLTTSGEPSYVTCCGDFVLFAGGASTSSGVELWISDGTVAGTMLLKDIRPGARFSSPQNFICLGNKVVFEADDGVHGNELWITDGTSEGTQLLADIRVGRDSAFTAHGRLGLFDACVSNGKLYFPADDGISGVELWVTDGTKSGTRRVLDLASGALSSKPTEMKALLGRVFFVASGTGATDGTAEAYVTDGTAAGTVRLMRIRSPRSFNPAEFTPVAGGRVAFAAFTAELGRELYATDGTVAGTRLVKDIRPGAGSGSPFNLTPVPGGKVIFVAAAPSVNMWISDGTANGTRPICPVDTKSAIVSTSDAPLRDAYGQLWFRADDSIHGAEVWRHDPATDTTRMMADINPGIGASNPRDFLVFGDCLLFPATGPSGLEVYKADTATGRVTLLKDINPGVASSSPMRSPTVWNGKVYFVATDATHGSELWATDGTAAGTSILKDIYPGSQSSHPSPRVEHDGKLYFTATAPTSGTELWVTDGTAAGTRLVKDIRSGSSSGIRSLVSADSLLFFVAQSERATGLELWVSDGTEAGTRLVKDIEVGLGSSWPMEIFAVGDVVYFSAGTSTHGRELWKSDGTAAGTTLVKDLVPGVASSEPTRFTSCGDRLYFFARTSSRTGKELWTTDGTAAGTTLVEDVIPDGGFDVSSRSGEIVCAGDKIFFAAHATSNRNSYLYCSDGNGVRRLGPSDLGPGDLSAVGDRVYFRGRGELYTSDGTAEGTRLLCDLWPGIHAGVGASFDPEQGIVTPCAGNLYFRGRTKRHGTELFRLIYDAPIVKRVGRACGPDTPTLTATPLRIGKTFEWRGTGAPVEANAPWVGIVLLGAPYTNPVSVDPTQTLAPRSCRVYLNPLARLFLRPVTPIVGERSWKRTDAVPNAASLVGVTAAAQAWFLKIGAPHTVVRMQGTNGLHLTLGR